MNLNMNHGDALDAAGIADTGTTVAEQLPTVLNMELELNQGCQPVQCRVIMGNEVDAVNPDFMTEYDVGLVIKCSGSAHDQQPPRDRVGAIQATSQGCQPDVEDNNPAIASCRFDPIQKTEVKTN